MNCIPKVRQKAFGVQFFFKGQPLMLYHNTPLTTIKEILGHTNIRTTETYADINEATIYNSISKIRFRELEKAEKRIARTFSFRS